MVCRSGLGLVTARALGKEGPPKLRCPPGRAGLPVNRPPLNPPHCVSPFDSVPTNHTRIPARPVGTTVHVQITGSCPLSVADATEADVMACASLCATAAADPARCIALNYSPWYARFPGTDPTVTGATETAELTFYAGHLANITTWLRRGRCLPGLTQPARGLGGGPACGAVKVGVAHPLP